MPRLRGGKFSTEMFARYQRSERVLVMAMIGVVINGVSTRKVTLVTKELYAKPRVVLDASVLQTDRLLLLKTMETLENSFNDAMAVLMLIEKYRKDYVLPVPWNG